MVRPRPHRKIVEEGTYLLKIQSDNGFDHQGMIRRKKCQLSPRPSLSHSQWKHPVPVEAQVNQRPSVRLPCPSAINHHGIMRRRMGMAARCRRPAYSQPKTARSVTCSTKDPSVPAAQAKTCSVCSPARAVEPRGSGIWTGRARGARQSEDAGLDAPPSFTWSKRGHILNS